MPQSATVAQPPRVPLILEPENRDSSNLKDAKLVNGYMERDADTKEYHLYKRPGVVVSSEKSAATGLGSYNWDGDVYEIFGSVLYKNGVSHGTGLNTAGGVYRFESTLGGTPKLVMGNGIKAYTTDGTTFEGEITDPDFPEPFLNGWAFLDGTLYVGTEDPALFGSEINDPLSWESDNVIIPQIEPDFGVAVAKQLVYVIFFKQWTSEVFYDQANEVGTPLGPVQGAKINWGCVSADSVQRLGDDLIWAGSTRESGVQIIMMSNLKAVPVSTPSIERLLIGADFSTVYSWGLQINGHRFYVLTVVEENLTLVYDLRERMWSQWADTNGDYLPYVSCTFTAGRVPILQHESNGKTYIMDSGYVNDAGALVSVDLYTPNFDGGTRRVKQMTALEFIADQVPGSILQIRSNDDDYLADKWTNFREVDLGQRRPILTNCGTFSRRAHHLRHRCNTALRIMALEPQLDIGTL